MPAWCRALSLLAVLASLTAAPVAAAQAQEIRLRLIARGAITADVTVVHVADRAHFCSAAADPWTSPPTPDTRPTPFPFYRLVFGQAAPAADLARPGPSVDLTLSNYFAASRRHDDPINDSIELMLQDHHFVGHEKMADPGYRLTVTYRADGRGGSFVARRLAETETGHGTLDVQGAWECPPITSELPVQMVSVHRLFAGATPVRPAPVPLALSRSDIPCIDRGCAGWRVTDEDSGISYLARVDLSRLHLARRLRRQAERGEVTLLIGADVRRGDPPRVIARALEGIEPAPPLPADRAGAPGPQAALP